MKEMCLPCYGTGQIKCLTCGGSGNMPDLSLLGDVCFKCKGTRRRRCQFCRGSGLSGNVRQEQPPERLVERSPSVAA